MWEGSVWPRMQYPSCYRLQDISPLLLFCDLCNDEPSHPTRCSFIARLPVSHTQRIASFLPRHPLKYNTVSLRPHSTSGRDLKPACSTPRLSCFNMKHARFLVFPPFFSPVSSLPKYSLCIWSCRPSARALSLYFSPLPVRQ